MPEARDRLSRQDDVVAAFSRRRISSPRETNIGRGNSVVFVLEDESEDGLTAGTPFRWRDRAMVGTPGRMGLVTGRGAIGTPRIGRTPLTIGRENLSPVVGSGRGRVRGSALPTWYPRRPLNDITPVMRAIERRRERRRSGEGLQTESPILQDWIFQDSSVSTSSARLEHNISLKSPLPTNLKRRCPPTIGKVPKILLDITNQKNGDPSCLTPQKKLLNNIETVEKVVMEELRKLKRTPLAKRVEREKRVRTLMSMR